MIIEEGENIFVSNSIDYEGTLTIGHCSIIGKKSEHSNIYIGLNLQIGAFSIIENDVLIGDNCEIGNYCTIYSDSKIGNDVKILSGSRVYWDAVVGNRCIINGYVSANVIIEDDVRFFGRIAHSHRDHTLDWENTVEESPIFKKGSFIGLGALIIGAVVIGEGAYISAGEKIQYNVPPNSIVYKGKMYNKEIFRGLIK